jgi:hypothetical protein
MCPRLITRKVSTVTDTCIRTYNPAVNSVNPVSLPSKLVGSIYGSADVHRLKFLATDHGQDIVGPSKVQLGERKSKSASGWRLSSDGVVHSSAIQGIGSIICLPEGKRYTRAHKRGRESDASGNMVEG